MQISAPRFMNEAFQNADVFRTATDAERALVADLHRDGVAIIDPCIPNFDNVVDEVLQTTRKRLPGAGRLQDAWRINQAIKKVATHQHILHLLNFAYGRKAIPFQTLNFTVGTQQKTHSDTIHFDCFPQHFMCGVWIAYEDADVGNGALHYVPGSHTLPILALDDFGIPRGRYFSRNAAGASYEIALETYIEQIDLPRRVIPLKKGQALVWAANVFHGGEPIQQPERTRNSQVTHYYFDRCLYTQPLWSDARGGRVMHKKVFDIAENRYVQPWYNGKPFSMPIEAHLRELASKVLLLTGRV